MFSGSLISYNSELEQRMIESRFKVRRQRILSSFFRVGPGSCRHYLAAPAARTAVRLPPLCCRTPLAYRTSTGWA